MKDFDERNFHDYGILEHLGCAAELCRIVRQSRDIVERYYGKYLKGAHTAALDSISAAVRDSGAMSRDSMEVSVACVPGASSPSLSCAVRGPCVVRRLALSCDGLVGAVTWKAVLRGLPSSLEMFVVACRWQVVAFIRNAITECDDTVANIRGKLDGLIATLWASPPLSRHLRYKGT